MCGKKEAPFLRLSHSGAICVLEEYYLREKGNSFESRTIFAFVFAADIGSA